MTPLVTPVAVSHSPSRILPLQICCFYNRLIEVWGLLKPLALDAPDRDNFDYFRSQGVFLLPSEDA